MTTHTLAARRILITGAGGSLGPVAAATAVSAGAHVALWDTSADTIASLARTVTGSGSVAHTAAVDLLNARAVDVEMSNLVDVMGGLDAVWHLVGGYRGGVPIENEPLENFELLINLGIRTTVHMARASAPLLMASDFGRFITISAPIATKPSAQSAAYSIAKAGSDATVLALADRFIGTSATANIIVVNAIATSAMMAADPDKNWSRFTTAEQLADTMVFVTSDAATSMNGQHVRLVGSA